MSKIIVLIKAMVINTFRSDKKKKNMFSNNYVGMFISGAIFGLMFVFYTIMLGPYFHKEGLDAEFLTMLFLATQIVILLFGTVFMVNVMFFSKDAEFMLYLPLKPVTVFAAKFLYVYLSELTLSVFVLGISGIAFGIVCALPIYFYILLIAAIMLVPSVPLIISSLLCVPIMFFISFFKNKSVFGIIFLILMFALLMFGYMMIFSNLPQGVYDGENIALPVEQLREVMKYILPNIALARIITLTSIDIGLDIVYVVLLTLGLFAVSLLISVFTYKKGMSAQLESISNKSDRELSFSQNSLVKSFFLKDFREILRNTGFAFYCLFSVITAPVMIVFFGVMMQSEVTGDLTGAIAIEGTAFMMTIMLVAGMNYAALSSISREGKNFYMLKTLPVTFKTHARAKILIADSILLTGLILSGIAIVAMLKVNILQVILFMGFGLILGDGLNKLMLYLDAKNPKLEWDNIAMAIKNSKGALITMFSSMGIGIAFMVSYIIVQTLVPSNILIIGYLIMWAVFYGLAIGLNYWFNKLCYDNVERLIANYE
ncbi:MAG: hypothetical protein PHE12_04625 [Clostridia bacterium]|nr:hypothetical protein [Clostridia bacterium]